MRGRIFRIIGVVLTLFFCVNVVTAKKLKFKSEEQLKKETIDTDWDEARYNRRSVVILKLENDQLKELPKGFDKLKNIQVLSLSYNELQRFQRKFLTCQSFKNCIFPTIRLM